MRIRIRIRIRNTRGGGQVWLPDLDPSRPRGGTFRLSLLKITVPTILTIMVPVAHIFPRLFLKEYRYHRYFPPRILLLTYGLFFHSLLWQYFANQDYFFRYIPPILVSSAGTGFLRW
jgi:hypothetical protein